MGYPPPKKKEIHTRGYTAHRCLETAGRFSYVNQNVRIKGSVCDVDESILEAVETVELKPSRARVQQLCSVKTSTSCAV